MCRRVGRCSCAIFDDKDLGAVLESGKGLPWYFTQLMESKVCLEDQLFFSMSFLQSRGLLAACRSRWANHRVIVSPLLIVRLALEAGMNGTSLDGSE